MKYCKNCHRPMRKYEITCLCIYKKYRIIEKNGKFLVQSKGKLIFWWRTLSQDYGYMGSFIPIKFSSYEGAHNFIKSKKI